MSVSHTPTDNYSSTLPLYTAARLAFILNLLLSAPLFLIPVRDACFGCVQGLIKMASSRRRGAGRVPDVLGNAAESTPLLHVATGPDGDMAPDHPAMKLKKSPTLRLVRAYSMSPMAKVEDHNTLHEDETLAAALSRHAVNFIIVASLCLIALKVGDLGLIIGLVGAVGGGIVVFVLPAAFALKAFRDDASAASHSRLHGSRADNEKASSLASVLVHSGLLLMIIVGILFTILVRRHCVYHPMAERTKSHDS